jgi:hypothetical protein
VPPATCRRRHRTPPRERRCVTTGHGCLWIGMPRTSSPRSWQGRPAKTRVVIRHTHHRRSERARVRCSSSGRCSRWIVRSAEP